MRLPCSPSFVLFSTLWVSFQTEARAVAPNTHASTIRSGGKRVRLDCFLPGDAGNCPAVLLLHGLDGGEGRHYRDMARVLNRKGYAAFVVHYFDRTGTRPEELAGLCQRFKDSLTVAESGQPLPRELYVQFTEWMGACKDALEHLGQHPRVDPDRIAVAGVSLGGFLATSLAADPRVKMRCLVEMFGGMPREVQLGLRALPPTLIIHGGKDVVVPVREANDLHALLQSRKVRSQIQIYPNADHCFVRPTGGLDRWSAIDAQLRVLDFLEANLAPKDRPLALTGARPAGAMASP